MSRKNAKRKRIDYPMAEEPAYGNCQHCEQEIVWHRNMMGQTFSLELSSAEKRVGIWYLERHSVHCEESDAFRRRRGA